MNIRLAVPFLLTLIPGIAGAQSLQAAGGLTVKDPGTVVSAGLGFSPASRLDVVVSIERIHQPTRTEQFSGGTVVTRGGTMTFLAGEIRASLLPPGRVTPFVVAGLGAGVSRPNVNSQFPDAVQNDLRVIYAGGGIRIPAGPHFSVTADARIMLGIEGSDSLVATWPIRAGVIWRF